MIPIGENVEASGWVVYILECSDGTLYTGSTNNIKLRLETHNKGNGAKYTRSRLPVRLAYTEECEGRSMALKREASIKKLSRQDKLELIS